jgi:hypothetical protein
METYFVHIQIGNTMFYFKTEASSARAAAAQWNAITPVGIICGFYKNGEMVGWND